MRDQVCGRRSDEQDQHVRDQRRLQRHEQRVDRGRIGHAVDQVARRDVDEDRDDRQEEEGERDGGRDHEGRAERASHGSAEARFRQLTPAVGAEQVGKELERGLAVLRSLHDGDLVAHDRLGPLRQRDREQPRRRGTNVGRVDETSVGLAERELADDPLDVRLLADRLARATRRSPSRFEHLARVQADRHLLARDDELELRPLRQVVDAADPRRVRARDREDERVRRERARLLDETVSVRDPVCRSGSPRRRRPPARRA